MMCSSWRRRGHAGLEACLTSQVWVSPAGLTHVALSIALLAAACAADAPADRSRVSGYVEATEVRVAAEVGGRLVDVRVDEGDRVSAGQVVAQFDVREIELALQRAQAERAQADAQVRLLRAGSRREDIRQASAQHQATQAEIAAAEAELTTADADLQRFEALLKANAGSRKQRDDALARRDVARSHLVAARKRAQAGAAAVARLEAGARREEVQAAEARVAAADAQIATLQKQLADATVKAPGQGMVTERLAEQGELLMPRAPLLVITDLDRAWANVFMDEPIVPRLRLGQPATVITDAGQSIEGRVTFISPKAEFTPRNVQTAEDRSRLVYRVKITVDNTKGILKQGMPVEAELPLQ
jgi:HlyD family secretion protein